MTASRLFLLRHGKAERRASSDAERALTETGRRDVLDVAEQFLEKGESISHCLVSPYRRAQQTADIFISHVAASLPRTTEELLTPDHSVRALLQKLQMHEGRNLLLVGHNFLMSELLAVLTDAYFDQSSRVLGTAELACLEYEILAPDMASCLYVLQPERRSV